MTRYVLRLSLCLWYGLQVLLPLSGIAAEPMMTRSEDATVSGTCATPASQEATPAVIVQAETLEYLRQDNRLVATGNVTVVYGESRLFADHLELNTESGIGMAVGHVRFSTPDDTLQASRIDFDLTAERGIVYQGSGVVAQTYHVAGERVERLGPQRFIVQQGRLTTCTGAVPDWELRARQASIGLGRYVTLQQPSLWIKGIPVFYLPYFVFPLKDERTTGLLLPHFGSSRRDGAVVGEEFFWAITDWMDSTIGLEYLSERGWKPEVEWRYALDPLSDGQLQGSFIHDQQTGDNLWRVFLQQRQEFGWGIRGLSQLDQRSQRDLSRRFSRDLVQESAVRTDSFGTLSKRFADSSLDLEIASFEGIPDSGSEAYFRRLPALRFEQFPTSLLGLAFFAVETSYSRLTATNVAEGKPVQRFDVFPRLTIPLTLAPWLQFNATGGIRHTFYDRQALDAEDVSRTLVDLRVDVTGPIWGRRYTQSAGGALIHLVETRLAYRYVPYVNQDNVPAFETLDEAEHFLDPLETWTLVDRINAANYMKVAVVNRFFALGASTLPAGNIREVARLTLSQGVDIRAATHGGSNLLGPLDIETTVHVWERWWLDAALRVAAATGALEEANWHVGVSLFPGWSAHIAGRHRIDPGILYVSGGVEVEVIKGLHLGYSMRYDGLEGAFREHFASLLYQAQCWSVDMRFRMRDAGDTEFLVRANLFRL